MTFLESKTELCSLLDIDYTDIANNQLISDAELGYWINSAAIRAWDFRAWDFSEGEDATNLTSATEKFTYPDTFVAGSVWLLMIAGLGEYDKKDYQSFRKFKINYPTATDKIYSEYKNYIYLNTAAHAVGLAITLLGKLKFTKLVNTTDKLPFSPVSDDLEYSGNRAIVKLAYAEALASRKYSETDRAATEEAAAFNILKILWEPFAEARANSQSKDRPFFDVPDYFGPGSPNIGQFGND